MRTERWATGGENLVIQHFGNTGGPVVAVIAGVHGDEPEGPLAAHLIARHLQSHSLTGQVKLLAVANPAAVRARTRLNPVDGGNLARCFPGDPVGEATPQLADTITTRLIAGSDLLVDLHSAGLGLEMPLFVGYQGSQRSTVLPAAVSMGLPLVWEHDNIGPGRSLSAAADLGVPALYVESAGGGTLLDETVRAYVLALDRVLQYLAVLPPTAVDAAPAPIFLTGGSGDLDAAVTANHSGRCVLHISAGTTVKAGQPVATIYDHGSAAQLHQLTAREPGTVMAVRRPTWVQPGDLVAMLGPLPTTLPTSSESRS